MEQRPRVTVSDPGRAGGAADVLGLPDVPREPRRLLVLSVVVLVVLAAAATALEVRERRADAARERRLAGVVALTATGAQLQLDLFDARDRVAVLTRRVTLRNDGPRPVTVRTALLGGLQLTGGPVPVAPGQSIRLLLEQRVPCSPEPAPSEPPRLVELDVRSGAGPRRAVAPLPRGTEAGASRSAARAACGYLPAEEAVTLQLPANGGRVVDGALLLDLSLRKVGVLPAVLLELRAGDGLDASLQDLRGDAVDLPVRLPPRTPAGDPAEHRFRLALRVTHCDDLRPGEPGSSRLGAADVLGYRVATDAVPEGGGISTVRLSETGPLFRLLSRRCGTPAG